MSSNEEKFWNYFKSQGLTEQGISGLYGNLVCESGFIPNAVEKLCIQRIKEYKGNTYTNESYTKAVDSGKISKSEFLNPVPNKQYGYGLWQITSASRKSSFYDYVKSKNKSIGDFTTQCEYLYIELSKSYKSVLSILKSTNSVNEASDIVLTKFERPATITDTTKKKRSTIGTEFYNKYKTGVINMNVIDKLISIAEAEVGYIEKASNKDLDSKTQNPRQR